MDYSTLEKTVLQLIEQCLSENEHVVKDSLFDFHLPDGVKQFDWPKDTFVEVKYRLVYDSLSRIIHSYDLKQTGKLVLIIADEYIRYTEIAAAKIRGRNIEIKQFSNFVKEATAIAEQNSKKQKRISSFTIENNVIERAKDSISKNKITLFLGAGVSASAGVVTWDSLIEQLCIKKKMPKIDSDIDSVIKGRYIIDEYSKENHFLSDDFYNDMRNILYKRKRQSKLIDEIANLAVIKDVESIISYNYDDLVEQEIRKQKQCNSVYDKSRPYGKDFLPIYHVHGFIPESKKENWSPIILGEREYHKVYQESYNWSNVEQLHALCRNVCLFIGLSMNDPNLRRLIDISIEGSEVEPVHYAFLRKIEHDINFMESIMRGFGVNCIWYENHEDLPEIINELAS